jgi:hypothetical protein
VVEHDRQAASEHRTFEEFLRKQQLTDNLVHFVVFAIAMVRPEASPEEGLRQTRYQKIFFVNLNKISELKRIPQVKQSWYCHPTLFFIIKKVWIFVRKDCRCKTGFEAHYFEHSMPFIRK